MPASASWQPGFAAVCGLGVRGDIEVRLTDSLVTGHEPEIHLFVAQLGIVGILTGNLAAGEHQQRDIEVVRPDLDG